MMLDIQKARDELAGKSMVEIERATALTWGSRAAASFQCSLEARSVHERFRCFYEGENYRQEALEHAAMTEDRGELVGVMHDEIEAIRKRALAALEGGRAAA
ncbi:MAG: hypothetical protein QOD77_446 [Thermoplasmata archaeon]|jgi:hypothetical protein|nr:hypothetical protein [Thermoplasmata archaeon]